MNVVNLTSRDVATLLIAAALLGIVGVAGWWWVGEVALIAMVVLATAMILGLILEIYRRTQASDERFAHVVLDTQRASMDTAYKQLEAYIALVSCLQPIAPLPDTRGWAASPDFLKKLAELVVEKKPLLVVEAGSGVSTLVVAYCQKRLGSGRVVALDHDASYAQSTRDQVALHGLSDVATVLHAPLKESAINGTPWLWYDLSSIKREGTIDLVVIDGPPTATQRHARYPAVPLLWERLAEDATILLDDGARTEERETVERWKAEFGLVSVDLPHLEKGAVMLSRPVKRAEEDRAETNEKHARPLEGTSRVQG